MSTNSYIDLFKKKLKSFWIEDNYKTYHPKKNILEKINKINTNLKLRTTDIIIS